MELLEILSKPVPYQSTKLTVQEFEFVLNAYIESFYQGDRRRFKKENGGCSWCSRHKYYRAMKKIHGIE